MLIYDHMFHREMCSMICQTGRPLPDWPGEVTTHHPCNIFLEKIVKINFNNYVLLNEVVLVHIFFSRPLINVLAIIKYQSESFMDFTRSVPLNNYRDRGVVW